MEIITFFSEIFSFEIFIQGFVCTICITLGLFMLISDQQSYFKDVSNFAQYTNGLKKLAASYFKRITLKSDRLIDNINAHQFSVVINLILLAFVLFFTTLVNGSIIHSISNKWMRSPNKFHLALKPIWMDPLIAKEQDHEKKSEADDILKIQVFNDIYKDFIPTLNIKLESKDDSSSYILTVNEFYYQAKHHLLTIPVWREYLKSTQNLINITDSFSLSFFILFCLCYVNFLINLFRDYFDGFKERALAMFLPAMLFVAFYFMVVYNEWDHMSIPFVLLILPILSQTITAFISNKFISVNIYNSLTSVILIYVSLIGYCLSSTAWEQNTKELYRKTYGVYRYENDALRKLTEDSIKKLIPSVTLSKTHHKE